MGLGEKVERREGWKVERDAGDDDQQRTKQPMDARAFSERGHGREMPGCCSTSAVAPQSGLRHTGFRARVVSV